MSSTGGLSSNTSNSNPNNNPMKLDAATRESLQAQSQARVLAGVLGSKKDSFSSGGGLNPLKGLYSAAAAAFLKNKQDRFGSEGSEQKKGSFDASVTAVKKLETQSASSDESWQNTNSKVSGPASGVDYKKYQWTGKPGPTGSDALEEALPVGGAAPEGDINAVFAGLSHVITDGGGEVTDNGDGTSDFSVLDLTGTLTRDGDTINGYVKAASGSYTFSVDKNGGVTIDASSGDESSAEYEQVRGMLAGSLDGVRRTGDAPAAPQDPGALTPEQQAAADAAAAKAAADKEAADQAAADQAAAEAAAAAKAAAAKAAADAAAAAAAAATPTGNFKDSEELMNAFLKEIKAAGGSSVNSNGDEFTRVSFKGMTGDVEERDGEIRGKLSFTTGSVEFRVTLSGGVTQFKTNGITLLNGSGISALKTVLGKLDRDGVNVFA